jgi:hypothetical protein
VRILEHCVIYLFICESRSEDKRAMHRDHILVKPTGTTKEECSHISFRAEC